MPEDTRKFKLVDDRGNLIADLPVYKGTYGNDVVDVRKLLADTGYCTFDPSFGSTASLSLDDHLHRRRSRYFALPRLSDRSACREEHIPRSLLSVAFRRAAHQGRARTLSLGIKHHTMVHEQLLRFYGGFRRDAHPMAIMLGVVGALSAFYPDSTRRLRSAAPHHLDLSPDREDADDRGRRAQVCARAADGLSAQRSHLSGELPAHDVLGSGGGIHGQSGLREGRWTRC